MNFLDNVLEDWRRLMWVLIALMAAVAILAIMAPQFVKWQDLTTKVMAITILAIVITVMSKKRVLVLGI